MYINQINAEQELSSTREKVMQIVANADKEGIIVVIAIAYMVSGKDLGDKIGNYPKAVFKRAIKRLRIAQADAPEYAENYEKAIQYIRQKWIEKPCLQLPCALNVR